MKKKLPVYTRQNAYGKWWCNTTHNGMDISYEGDTIEIAQMLISVYLWHNGIRKSQIDWRSPQTYTHSPIVPKSTFTRPKIDNL